MLFTSNFWVDVKLHSEEQREIGEILQNKLHCCGTSLRADLIKQGTVKNMGRVLAIDDLLELCGYVRFQDDQTTLLRVSFSL